VGTNGDGPRNGTGGGVFLPNGQGPGQSNYGVFQTENQVQISASGQRVTSNTYLIDGVSVDSLIHGGSAIITPNPESVAQISITSSSYDAGEGRNVGAQIKTVTKSSTNTYHGSLFFQYDEPGLNAYQTFGGPTSTPSDYAHPMRVNNKQREYAASNWHRPSAATAHRSLAQLRFPASRRVPDARRPRAALRPRA
jgi:hypothetical protein